MLHREAAYPGSLRLAMGHSMEAFEVMGRHLLRREGDILFVKFQGPIDIQEMQLLFAAMVQMREGSPVVFHLYDGARAGLTSPAARRWAAENMTATHRAAGIACYGVSAVVRAIAELHTRAIALFRKQAAVPMVYFATEAEARAWIDRQRALRHDTP